MRKLAKGRAKGRKAEPDDVASVPATISFQSDSYATLEEIAKQKKVSLAWVVREAVEQYVFVLLSRHDTSLATRP